MGLCQEVGTQSEVRIRREVVDTGRDVVRIIGIMYDHDQMASGSYREGFRLESSDIDIMSWSTTHEVICDLSQISLTNPQHTTILMESDDNLPPGYTRLELITIGTSKSNQALHSLHRENDTYYVSSKKYHYHSLYYIQRAFREPSSFTEHGPCWNFVMDEMEEDLANCFRSDHWPDKARSWIERCQRKGWPLKTDISNIVKSGFHVVPIGSSPEEYLEWRLSFSDAEQKLVYSFNHCQFICYGILKIFLKEVINEQSSSPILCSYFIKTVLFWVIQNDKTLNWTPENLLCCFWNCFKLLIHWVNTGCCPNFFIPQNNMFRVKVTGHTQSLLFDRLYYLYNEGLSCLLLSSTVGHHLNNAIVNETLECTTEESGIRSQTDLEMHFCQEIRTLSAIAIDFSRFFALISQVELLLGENLTVYQMAILQYLTPMIFRSAALMIQEHPLHTMRNNKIIYSERKTVLSFYKLSSIVGGVSDILYIAMYFYRDCQFLQSLRLLERAKERLSQPYIVYHNVNAVMYTSAMKGLSLSGKLKKALIDDIDLNNQFTYVDEIAIEMEASKKSCGNSGRLLVPPLVILHMLFVLNHHNLGDTVKSHRSLQDFHTLMHSDDRIWVPLLFRDISWQLLGMCQQTCGDPVKALISFHRSLDENPFHKIQIATYFRMLLSVFSLTRQCAY